MFSASRSRRVSIVPIIQSLAQLEKNYGKEGAEIIVDNTQLTVFGGFAPNSETAQVLSKSLGTKTVMSGSVSQSKNDPSRSLQMIERPLMTAEELKVLPKGTFIVTKTGFNPIRVKLKLFFEWGIQFEKEPFVVPLRDNKDVCYADRDTLMRLVYEKYASTQKRTRTKSRRPAFRLNRCSANRTILRPTDRTTFRREPNFTTRHARRNCRELFRFHLQRQSSEQSSYALYVSLPQSKFGRSMLAVRKADCERSLHVSVYCKTGNHRPAQARLY